MYSYIFCSKHCSACIPYFKYFIVSLIISPWIHWLFRSVLFNFHIVVNSPNLLLLIACFHFTIFGEHILYNFSPFKLVYWGLFYGLDDGLFWRLWLRGVLCVRLLGFLVQRAGQVVCVLDDGPLSCFIHMEMGWKSPAAGVQLTILPFNSVRFWCMHFWSLGAYIFIMVISS